ncbi:MAG: LexA family protein [Litorivicinus sp.]
MTTILLPIRREPTLTEGDELEALLSEGMVEIPLLGEVAAGQPIEAWEQQELVLVPKALQRKDTFALRVKGDSMIEMNIQNGDLVVIERTQTAANGETAVVRINQETVTLKKLYVQADGVCLMPANSSMEPIWLDNADVEVVGILRGVIRDQI